MKILFDKNFALQQKTKFKQNFKLAIEEMRAREKSNMVDKLTWGIPILILSYFAIFYGVAAGSGWIALICVLINLIVPVARIGEAIQKYCWFKDFINSGRLEKDTTPSIVKYNDALESSDNVELYLEFDPPSSSNRKCHIYLDSLDNEDNRLHIGDFNIIIDPDIKETTVDFENETVIIPWDKAEFTGGNE